MRQDYKSGMQPNYLILVPHEKTHHWLMTMMVIQYLSQPQRVVSCCWAVAIEVIWSLLMYYVCDGTFWVYLL